SPTQSVRLRQWIAIAAKVGGSPKVACHNDVAIRISSNSIGDISIGAPKAPEPDVGPVGGVFGHKDVAVACARQRPAVAVHRASHEPSDEYIAADITRDGLGRDVVVCGCPAKA